MFYTISMKHITYKRDGSLGILTISRPESLNALNSDCLKSIAQCLKEASGIQVMVVTGEGKAFASGADIEEMYGCDAKGIDRFFRLGQKVAALIEESAFITIAAINGYALGGGLELALACDFIYASEKAKVGLPEVTLGIIPAFGGVTRLIERAGKNRAMEMMTTGRKITAQEALEWGIVNQVCAPEGLMTRCFTTAREITSHSPEAIKNLKKAISKRDGNMRRERELAVSCFKTKACQQKMKGFLKR